MSDVKQPKEVQACPYCKSKKGFVLSITARVKYLMKLDNTGNETNAPTIVDGKPKIFHARRPKCLACNKYLGKEFVLKSWVKNGCI